MSKYRFEEKELKDVFIVTIVGDSNDADYVTETAHYNKSVFEQYVIDGLIDLRDNFAGSHELENYPNEYDLDIPFNGWDGYCHSLEELSVDYIDINGKVWKVVF